MMDQLIGKRLDGRYQITELVGVGGMANVYKATDLLENRPVAVKILREEFLDNEELVRRFKNESKAIGLLSHPNIVKVFDVNFSSAVQFIVMEYIDGITLKQYIDAVKPLSWKDAVYFSEQLLKALQHAHDRGIVHRDIKPQNVMLLENGNIKVMDFGIARFSRSETRTITDKAIGSVHYISPEQAKGDITDSKADLYSVGIMMYEMLTGTLPFESDSPVQVAIKQISDQARRPRELVESIPEGLEEITLKAMAKDPVRRYQSASQMLRDIDDFKRNPSIVFEYKYFNDAAPTKYIEKPSTPKEEIKKPADAPKEGKKKKTSKRPKITVFVLSGVALASMICTIILFLFMAGAFDVKHGNIKLDNFVGMPFSDVKSNASYKGLQFNPIEKYNADEQFPVGTIFAQSPLPGREIKDNGRVTIYVSLGPEEVSLPNVVGMDVGEAKEALRKLGLSVRQVNEYDSNLKANTVLRMSPSPNDGKTVYAGDLITITVNVKQGGDTSSVLVPNVVGKTYYDAFLELSTLILQVPPATLVPSSEPKGTVIEQSVKEGTIVPVNTVVSLTVSDGTGKRTYEDITFTLPNGPSDGAGGNYSYTVHVYVDGIQRQTVSANKTGSFLIAPFEVTADGTLVEVYLEYNSIRHLYIRYSVDSTAYNYRKEIDRTAIDWPFGSGGVAGTAGNTAGTSVTASTLPQTRKRLADILVQDE